MGFREIGIEFNRAREMAARRRKIIVSEERHPQLQVAPGGSGVEFDRSPAVVDALVDPPRPGERDPRLRWVSACAGRAASAASSAVTAAA